MRNSVNVNRSRRRHRGRLKSAAVLVLLAAFVAVSIIGQTGIVGMAAPGETYDCGLEEHVHTSECYAEDTGALICSVPEHTHTDMCLASDPSADVETADNWETALPDLTGVWADDLIAVAQSQLGYTESTANFVRAEDGETRQGYTRYGAWYGDAYGGWNAMFVSFCLHYAGIPEEEFPEDSDVLALSESLDESGLYIYDTTFKPMAGDLIFFDTDEDGQADRVGIITCLFDDNTMTVIEGDCEDAVAENTYGKDDGQIIGYGVLPENPDAESGTDDELSLIFEGDDYIVGVTYGSDAMLPDDVTLTADEYGQDSDTYMSRCEEAADFYGWDEDEEEEDREIRLFDIGLYTQGENGELIEIEPAVPVQVTIMYLDETNDDEDEDAGIYTVTHFGDEIETVFNETMVGETGEAISFQLDSFSDIMVFAGNSDGDTNQYIILNIGNEDGTYRDSKTGVNYGYWPWVHIAGYDGNGNNTSDGFGNAWRVTVAIPASYFSNDSLTINLPGNADLGTNFYIYGSDRSDGYYVNLPGPNAYDYALAGWINIGSGEYYSVTDETTVTTATINAEDDNIFYADWVAASYDVGTDDGNVENTVSTDFVTIRMFDYNELFNLYSADNVSGDVERLWNGSLDHTDSYPGTYSVTPSSNSRKEYWVLGDYFYTEPYGSSTRTVLDNIGSFAFYDGKGPRSGWDGYLGFPANRAAQSTGSVGLDPSDLDMVNISEHLGVTTWDSPFFTDYLFNTNADNDGVVGVHYIGEGDQLLKYGVEGDTVAEAENYVGYYYYDSRYNAANYNQSEERFYVYNEPSNIVGCSYPEGFFPYNTYTEAVRYDQGGVNYFYGMSMEVDFYLPNMVGSNTGNKVADDDMTFNFSGDDDIWIFVDDVLVLDMSGVHNKSYGSIDFCTGIVTLQTTDTAGSIVWTGEYKDNIEGFNATGSQMASGSHTLRVYYMERGGNSSNLGVSFNIAPTWEYESDTAGAVTVEKQWQDAQGNVLEGTATANCPDVTMGLFEKVEAVTFGDDANIIQVGDTYYYVSGSSMYAIGSDYYARDGAGNVVAYYDYNTISTETRYVYVLVELSQNSSFENPVTLSYDPEATYFEPGTGEEKSSYGWYYAWELLDQEKVEAGDYVVMEISTSSAYTLVSEKRNDTTYGYEYWTIVGEEEIETWLRGHEEDTEVAKYPVILTDAASDESKGTLGWAIYLDASDGGTTPQLKSKQLTFSMNAEEKTVTDVTAGHEITTGIYGVVSNTEVAACDPSVVWYLEFAEKPEGDSLDIFYICYEIGDETWYLAVNYTDDDEEPVLTWSTTKDQDPEDGYYDEFYCDELGEVRLYNLQYRLTLSSDSDGTTVGIEGIDQDAYKFNNIKIYTLSLVEDAQSYTYQFVNRLQPVIVEKIDSRSTDDSVTCLDGAKFILSKTVEEDSGAETYYWSGTDWTKEKNDAYVFETAEITLDIYYGEDDLNPGQEVSEEKTFEGAFVLPYLTDGSYELTETEAPFGYGLLPASITISVRDGKITSAEWSGTVDDSSYSGFINVSEDGMSIVVKNQMAAYELPNAGGPGIMWFYLAGSLLLAGGGLILWRRLRYA